MKAGFEHFHSLNALLFTSEGWKNKFLLPGKIKGKNNDTTCSLHCLPQLKSNWSWPENL